jgi:hypothetical protein
MFDISMLETTRNFDLIISLVTPTRKQQNITQYHFRVTVFILVW